MQGPFEFAEGRLAKTDSFRSYEVAIGDSQEICPRSWQDWWVLDSFRSSVLCAVCCSIFVLHVLILMSCLPRVYVRRWSGRIRLRALYSCSIEVPHST